MEVPDKILKKWKALRSPGDADKMSEESGNESPDTFNRVFREGRCRDEVFKRMADFYEKKAQLIKEYL
jgi:hypothetical protein